MENFQYTINLLSYTKLLKVSKIDLALLLIKKGNINPPHSYKAAPTPGPNMYPSPKHVWVQDMTLATLFGNIFIKIPNAELHAIAVPVRI